MELSRLNQAMRAIASAMENPVIILLLLLLVVTIFLIGWLRRFSRSIVISRRNFRIWWMC